MLPSDLDHGAPRVKAFDQDRATEAQQDVVDLLEEARETTIIRSAHFQITLHRYHERKIRGRILEVGDLVLQRTQSTKEKHKLSPPWEGPYTAKGRQRQRPHQHMEHRTVTSFLPLMLGLTNFSFNVCSYKHPSLRTLGLGRSGAPRGCDTTPLFYYHIVILFTQMKG